MRRTLVTCLLLLVIIGSFIFVGLKSASQGADQNWFNKNVRSKIAASPTARNILSLHYDGDARADYLGGRYKKIIIEVDLMEDANAYLDALNLLRDCIQEITGKETLYVISDKTIPYERVVDNSAVKRIAGKYRSQTTSGDTAALYILYASRMAGQPALLGLTFQEDGVVLFADALADFAGPNIAVLPRYEASTALHEFGHQIGLPHNDESGCLMNESAEQAHVPRESPDEVITDFCEYELEQIKNMSSLRLQGRL